MNWEEGKIAMRPIDRMKGDGEDVAGVWVAAVVCVGAGVG